VPYTWDVNIHGAGTWKVDVGRGYYIRGRKHGKRQAIRINSAFCNVVGPTYGHIHQETGLKTGMVVTDVTFLRLDVFTEELQTHSDLQKNYRYTPIYSTR
jgi:hypothetical protein